MSRGGVNKRLDDAEEATLVLYCWRLIMLGDNPGRKDIEAAANSILRAAGKKKVSKPWLTRWLNNHKALLKPRTSKPLAAERKAAHEEADILEHFRKFDSTMKEYYIKKTNCWNFDETGWRIGILNGRLVFTFPDVSAVYMEDLDTRETLTSIEACNAAGEYAPSMLILLGIEL
ncbi:hypothetical protein DL95DRAFT_307853 [Leptodontidium sp. 2 PMI_412]|nr:hypothetical protein DL95DRAFT_307853 [Leptodontidium sp. 2 PMI_412]